MNSPRSLPAALALACACLVGPVLGSGCVLSLSTDGTKIPADAVGEIVVGQSDRADVVRLLGAPDDIIYSNLEHDPLFERAFRYERNKRKTTFFTIIIFSTARTDRNKDVVIVFFDDEGIVDDVAARLDMDRPRWGAAWSDDD